MIRNRFDDPGIEGCEITPIHISGPVLSLFEMQKRVRMLQVKFPIARISRQSFHSGCSNFTQAGNFAGLLV